MRYPITKTPDHELTKREFLDKKIRERMNECQCSLREASYGLTPDVVEAMHTEAVVKAADAGIIINSTVLDSMGPAAWNVIKWHGRNYPNYIVKQPKKPKATA